jgi:hypothetical protein
LKKNVHNYVQINTTEGGTFVSAAGGTFVSAAGGTIKPLLSKIGEAVSFRLFPMI